MFHEFDEHDVPSEAKDYEGSPSEWTGNTFKLHDSSDIQELDSGKREYSIAIKDICDSYGEYIPKEKQACLKSSDALEDVNTYRKSEYRLKFPNSPPNVLGHHNPATDTIHLIDVDDGKTIKHTSTHESIHKASFQETEIQVDEHGNQEVIRISGVRRIGRTLDENVGLNEGITEMLTLESLDRRGEIDAIKAVSAYSDQRMFTAQLAELIGEGRVSKAYFSGEFSQLTEEINRLGKSETTFQDLSKHLDTLLRTRDVLEYRTANLEAQRILFIMRRNKYDGRNIG